MLSSKTFAIAASAAVVTFASAALAQAPAPAAARPATPAAQVRHGAAIPGICTYSSERAIGTSEVGKYVDGRMKQLIAETNTELSGEETIVKNEAKAIDAARATSTPDALEKRASDLQVRYNTLVRKKDLRQRELQATERKALMRVLQELDPIALAAYQQRNCSILIGDGVLIANPQMDLTDSVVQGLNAKLKSFAFNRERLDAPAAPAAPAR
ncbi:MAG: OmpH family outer membrane protein [Pseudomonadota bacterium]